MTMIGENDSNLNNVPKMFGGIPGPSSNSGLPKKSYSISKWKPGNTLKTATTAGSNNSYLWNMPATSSTSGAAAKEDQKTSTSQTSSSSAANDNLFKDENEEEEDSDDDYSLIPTKIPTGDSPTWALGNNFDHFLNQCSIQSFLFLLKTCRDPQTVLWLEAYTQPAITTTRNRLALQEHRALQLGGSANSKLLSYHGLAAMNMNTEAVVVPDQDPAVDECPVASLSRSNRNFLSHFYLQRLVSHFTGRQAYGRADQFLQELLWSAPSIIVSDDDDGTAESCLVDPTRIAEQILEMRQVVAQEWQTRAERVPDLHVDLKRLQFNRLLQSYSTDNKDESFQ